MCCVVSSLEVSRRSPRGVLSCDWLLSLCVDEQSGAFQSNWLPSPTSFVAMAARHFRELLTATAATSHPSTVKLLTLPCAYIPHSPATAHTRLQYTVDERSGETSSITTLQPQLEEEQEAAEDGSGGGALTGSAVLWMSQCFVDRSDGNQLGRGC